MSMGMESGEDEELPKFSGSKASAAYLYRLRQVQVQVRHCGAAVLILFRNVPAESCFLRFLVEVSKQLDCHMSS